MKNIGKIFFVISVLCLSVIISCHKDDQNVVHDYIDGTAVGSGSPDTKDIEQRMTESRSVAYWAAQFDLLLRIQELHLQSGGIIRDKMEADSVYAEKVNALIPLAELVSETYRSTDQECTIVIRLYFVQISAVLGNDPILPGQ